MAENLIRHTIRIHETDEPEIYAELKKQRSGIGSIKRLLSLAKIGLLAERMYLHGAVGMAQGHAIHPGAGMLLPSPDIAQPPADKPSQSKGLLTDDEFTDDLDPLANFFDQP